MPAPGRASRGRVKAEGTILGLFLEQVRLGSHRAALRERLLGRWVTTTWGVWCERSTAIAAALIDGGLAPGDRVAVLSGTRQAWFEVDMAVLMARGITVPIYPTLTAEQAAHIVADSGASVVFAEEPIQAEKLLGAGARSAIWGSEGDPQGGSAPRGVGRVVLFDVRSVLDAPDPQGRRAHDLPDVAAACPCPVESLDALEARGRALLQGAGARAALEARSAAGEAGDVATIMYTSGTSGPPRGVMLTNDNFLFEVMALEGVMRLGPQDEQVLFLPLAHVFGRMLEVAQLRAGFVTSFSSSPAQAMDDMLELNPTFFATVPRFFEVVREAARRAQESGGELRRRAAAWAVGVGLDVSRRRRHGDDVPLALLAQHRYADKHVLSKVRGRFGARFRFAISGGAPLARELGEWFHAHGVSVLEGYGLTETTSATHLNAPERFSFGSVGAALPGVEVRLADDGEILVRGRGVMKGYFGRPEATAEAIDGEGFLHTGDVGEVLPDGSLRITDRKKDIIVTSGGKSIAPQNIEAMLRRSPLISQAVVYGDNRRHLVALLTLDRAAICRWAKEHDRPEELASLAQDAAVRALLQGEVDRVNQGLARFEGVRGFAVLDRELSVERGELTPTAKIRRRAVHEAHRALFEALYGSGPGKPA
jgi:long-chain acyl-CoA synthetase